MPVHDAPSPPAPSDPSVEGPTVVAIGNFDGVHRGHRVVFSAAIALSRRLSQAGPPTTFCVYTFDPAPTALLAPQRHQPRILTLAERRRRIREAGAERVVVEPFTRAFASGTAEWFAREVLEKRLHARGVVVGPDFRFGMGREGDADTLRTLLPGVEVVTVAPEEAEGGVISSSRIRKLVAAGEVEAAARLLGRPHRLEGLVVHGDHRGRTIGFPTANVDNVVELLPKNGVYAVRVRRGAETLGADTGDAEILGGVANIGTRPTFYAGEKVAVEVHLFDFSGDLYGEVLEVELLAFIRPEQRFSGIEALKRQIGEDAEVARELLARERRG